MLENLLSTQAEVGGVILDSVLALVISLYVLIDGPRFRAHSLAVISSQHRAKALFLQDDVSRVLSRYLCGERTLAPIIGVVAGVGTTCLTAVRGRRACSRVCRAGVDVRAHPLGGACAAIHAVPHSRLVIQEIENNLLAPRISGHAVGLHPLGAMFAVLVGVQLAGLAGGLLAVRLAGVLWVLLGAPHACLCSTYRGDPVAD